MEVESDPISQSTSALIAYRADQRLVQDCVRKFVEDTRDYFPMVPPESEIGEWRLQELEPLAQMIAQECLAYSDALVYIKARLEGKLTRPF